MCEVRRLMVCLGVRDEVSCGSRRRMRNPKFKDDRAVEYWQTGGGNRLLKQVVWTRPPLSPLRLPSLRWTLGHAKTATPTPPSTGRASAVWNKASCRGQGTARNICGRHQSLWTVVVDEVAKPITAPPLAVTKMCSAVGASDWTRALAWAARGDRPGLAVTSFFCGAGYARQGSR